MAKKIKEEKVDYPDHIPIIPQNEELELKKKEQRTLIKTLRERTISVDECINMLDNRTELFEELLEKMYIFEDKGIVFLLSDLRFVKFTPIYMFNRLRKRIEDNSISLDEFLQYLKILSKEINNKSDLSYKII